MATRDGLPAHKWVIAGSVMLGTIMAVLDSSIVNVALPSISGTVGATIEQITWVITGYILANVIIMPLVALLSQWFGRKNFYMANVIIFTVASIASSSIGSSERRSSTSTERPSSFSNCSAASNAFHTVAA